MRMRIRIESKIRQTELSARDSIQKDAFISILFAPAGDSPIAGAASERFSNVYRGILANEICLGQYKARGNETELPAIKLNFSRIAWAFH